MTVLFSSNIDSETALATPSWWSNKVGTWFVIDDASAAVSGSKSFRNATGEDGGAGIINGISAVADMVVETRQKAVSFGSLFPVIGHILRCAADYSNCYTLLLAPVSGGWTAYIFKRVAGGYTPIHSVPLTHSLSVGDVIAIESTVNGSTISAKIWNETHESKPSSPSISITDSSVTAAGYAGLYYALGGTTGPIYADNLSVSDIAAGDTTAPTLSGPSGTATGTSTASGSVATNEANGTLYYLATTNATESAATVKAGASQAVSATGTQSVSFTGLLASTTYYAHYLHRDASGNDSTVSNSASFTTSAPADTTPPTLTSASATATGQTTASGSVSTNEANGTLYRYVSANPTETAATVKASGSTSTVSATGSQTVSFTGLTAGTTYYAHYLHRDAAGNDSIVANTASFTTAAAPNNAYAPANILFSPYNWKTTSGLAKSINAGAYFKTLFTGTTCTLEFDLSGISTPYPQISYRIDGFGVWITVPIAASVALTIPTETADYADKGGHLLEVVIKANSTAVNRWDSQQSAVVLTGIILDAGKVLAAPAAMPLRGLYYGDSITEALRTVKATGSELDQSDAAQGWAFQSAKLVGSEFGIVGFGGTGWTNWGVGSVQGLDATYDKLWSGEARSFSNPPDYIVINDGTNDSGSVTTAATAVLNGLLSATPKTTKIILLRPFNGDVAADLVAAAAACSNPARVTYVDTTGWFNTANSSDALHPYGNENIAHIAPLLAVVIRAAVSPLRGSRSAKTISINLVDGSGSAKASLTGLKWAFFDQATPDAITVAADQGTGETTDASGNLTITVYTTLSAGQTGWLEVTDSNGNAATVHKAFSGPVVVA